MVAAMTPPESVRHYRCRTYPKLLVLGSWVAVALVLLVELWHQRATGGTSPWMLLALLGLVATGIPMLIWAWRTRPRDPGVLFRLPRMFRRDRAAQKLYAEERYAEAMKLWEQARRDAAELPVHHTLAFYNVGICRLLSGEPDQAVELIEAALASGWHETWALRRHRVSMHAGHALSLAVVGRLDAAGPALELAHGACPPARRGLLVATEAVVEARGSRFAELLRAATERAALAASSGTLPQRRTLALLTAFAKEATLADEEAVTAALAEAPDLQRGSVDYLAPRWPELAEFIARHELDGRLGGSA